MPLRMITLDDGKECSRNIVNTHPDGTEFLPEEFALSVDPAESERIYRALERLLQNRSPQG